MIGVYVLVWMLVEGMANVSDGSSDERVVTNPSIKSSIKNLLNFLRSERRFYQVMKNGIKKKISESRISDKYLDRFFRLRDSNSGVIDTSVEKTYPRSIQSDIEFTGLPFSDRVQRQGVPESFKAGELKQSFELINENEVTLTPQVSKNETVSNLNSDGQNNDEFDQKQPPQSDKVSNVRSPVIDGTISKPKLKFPEYLRQYCPDTVTVYQTTTTTTTVTTITNELDQISTLSLVAILATAVAVPIAVGVATGEPNCPATLTETLQLNQIVNFDRGLQTPYNDLDIPVTGINFPFDGCPKNYSVSFNQTGIRQRTSDRFSGQEVFQRRSNQVKLPSISLPGIRLFPRQQIPVRPQPENDTRTTGNDTGTCQTLLRPCRNDSRFWLTLDPETLEVKLILPSNQTLLIGK